MFFIFIFASVFSDCSAKKKKNKKFNSLCFTKNNAYAFHTIYISLMFVLIKQSCF